MSFLRDLFAPFFGGGASSGRATQCPTCAVELAVCLVDDYAVSRCGQCRGLFCPKHEFEKLVEKADADLSPVAEIADTEHTFRASSSARGCPQCGKEMTNFQFRSQVWLDACPDGHGVWLDRGELGMVHSLRASALQMSPSERAAMGRAFSASADAMSRHGDEMRRFREAREEAGRQNDYSSEY